MEVDAGQKLSKLSMLVEPATQTNPAMHRHDMFDKHRKRAIWCPWCYLLVVLDLTASQHCLQVAIGFVLPHLTLTLLLSSHCHQRTGGSTASGRRGILMCATDGVWDVMTGQDGHGGIKSLSTIFQTALLVCTHFLSVETAMNQAAHRHT